jgi:DNA-binding winged helix-turn-helix (wHTH) protein
VRVAFGEFVLDPGSRQLLRGDGEIHLEPKALDLLELLVTHRPNALSKSRIRDRLWAGTAVSDSSVTTLVAALREALGDDAHRPHFIRTAYGFGYSFCGDATEEKPEARPRARRETRFRLFGEQGEVSLNEGENVLGRGDEAVAWIDSPLSSRRHARILVSGGRATLEDLGSKNGTRLNGTRVDSPTVLADRDEVKIGDVVLTFRVLPGAASTKTEAQT